MVEEALRRLEAVAERNASAQSEMRELVYSQKLVGQQLVAEVQGLNKAQELGRQLVEQRARVLQLERQNYILREENDDLRTRKNMGLDSDAEVALPSESRIQQIEALLQGLSRSRALKLLSIVTNSPQRDLDAIRQHLAEVRHGQP